MNGRTETESQERENSKNVSLLRRLLPFFRPYRMQVFAASIMLIAAACFTLVMPIAMRRMIDLGFDQDNASYIDQYFLAFIGVAGALAIATALRYFFVTRLGERVVTDLRRAVYDHAIGMSPRFFETVRTGETLSRITTDTTLIQSLVSSSVSIALRNMLLMVGGLIMMFVTSTKLALMVLLIVPFLIVPIMMMGKRVRSYSRDAQDRLADASAVAGETLGNIRDVQSFAQETAMRESFGAAAEGAFDASRKRIKARAWLTAVVIFLAFTGVVAVMWVGARDVLAERMSAGELAQFIFYAIILAGSFGALTEVWTQAQQAAGATERLVEILDSRSDIAAPANPIALPVPPKGRIAVNDLSFSYPSRPDERALENFSMTVEPGETVALVGPSGAGKSTVFQLLQRFYDPDSGTIMVDDVPITEADPSDLRRRFAVVAQEPAIFAQTVFENIRFSRPDAQEADVYAAARIAAADGFIKELPDGYNTYVGERGVMLSGGQKQRIAIARAIISNAPVLLLDEATSALDAQSERAVQAAFDELSKDRTTLVIAHRLATVKSADRILVIDDGRIVAEGTHDMLVKEGGLYARLAKLQFTGEAA